MTTRVNTNLGKDNKDTLREMALRYGLRDRLRGGGSLSALMRRIAERYRQDVTAFDAALGPVEDDHCHARQDDRAA